MSNELEAAKEELIEQSGGMNDYRNIRTWSELADKASFEQDQALFRADLLRDIAANAREKAENSQPTDTPQNIPLDSDEKTS